MSNLSASICFVAYKAMEPYVLLVSFLLSQLGLQCLPRFLFPVLLQSQVGDVPSGTGPPFDWCCRPLLGKADLGGSGTQKTGLFVRFL